MGLLGEMRIPFNRLPTAPLATSRARVAARPPARPLSLRHSRSGVPASPGASGARREGSRRQKSAQAAARATGVVSVDLEGLQGLVREARADAAPAPEQRRAAHKGLEQIAMADPERQALWGWHGGDADEMSRKARAMGELDMGKDAARAAAQEPRQAAEAAEAAGGMAAKEAGSDLLDEEPEPEPTLATAHPEWVAHWDHENNAAEFGFSLATPAASLDKKQLFWKCDVAHDHTWRASLAQRRRNPGCPCCENRKLSVSNSLAAVAPEIAEEWHPTLNLPTEENYPASPPKHTGTLLDPTQIMAMSAKKVWWQCPEGADHVYQVSPKARVERGHVCPFCANKKVSVTNSLATVFPELSKEWHGVLNEGLQPEDVAFTANLDVLTTRHTFCF